MGELDGKVAIITGAGSGMARATAQVFVREGARVLAADISGREEETAAELGDAVVPFRVDISQADQVEAMYAAAHEAFGKVDAVLNVAGIGGGGRLIDTTDEDYERIMAVDLKGVFLCTKYGVKPLRANGGGVILNVASIGGLAASASIPTSTYSAAKAGVISYTKATAVEYGRYGIRCNAICPGFIETEMAGGKGAAEKYPALLGGAALRRPGQPEEIAELLSFLASERAGYITGAIIPIDGGVTAALP
jgi:NAD(P)-dependent dehydrogenase (short-subunit alcohol dehydrogenase family)